MLSYLCTQVTNPDVQECWISQILDSLESPSFPARHARADRTVSILPLGIESALQREGWHFGHTWPTTESYRINVGAISCYARLACRNGFYELPCPDSQQNLLRIPFMVLVSSVADLWSHWGVRPQYQAQPGVRDRRTSDGGLWAYSGGSFRLFPPTGLVI